MFAKVFIGIVGLVLSAHGGTAADLKDPVRGLTDRQGPASAAYQSVVNTFVVRVAWKDIHPSPGVLDVSDITTALSAPRAAGKAVRLRVTAGVDAPDWVKQAAGSLTWHADNASIGTIGRFWRDEFGDAYEELQRLLADEYDEDNAQIREVVVARCTTEFAEPYTRQTNQLALNRDALIAAEYTAAEDDQCHAEEIEAHAVWEHTRSYLAFNPYQRIDDATWTGSVDLPFTEQMIDHCRQVLGARCVLGNNSLDPDRPAAYQQMYAYLAGKGAPISFQTATAEKICNQQAPCPPGLWNDTLDLALAYGAGAVELPATSNGYSSWPLSENPPYHGLAYYDQELEGQ